MLEKLSKWLAARGKRKELGKLIGESVDLAKLPEGVATARVRAVERAITKLVQA